MTKVTLFLLVASVIALTLAETDRKAYMRFHRECQEDPKTKLEEENWKKITAGEKIKGPNAGAYTLCMSKKFGLQGGNGKINKAGVKQELEHYIQDEATLEKFIAKCAVEKNTPEETALNLIECLSSPVTLKVTLAETDRKAYMRFHRECQEDPKTKVDEENWKKITAGEKIKDPNAGAYTLCMSKKSGLQGENGKINKAGVKQELEHYIQDEATLEKFIAECAVEKDTPEETALNLRECLSSSATLKVVLHEIV